MDNLNNSTNNPVPQSGDAEVKPQREIDALTDALLGKKPVEEKPPETSANKIPEIKAEPVVEKVAEEKAGAGPSPAPAEPVTLTEKPTPIVETPESTDALETARRALEGPENTDKRLREKEAGELDKRKSEIEKELASLDKEKEKHEVRWVELDKKKRELTEIVKPIREKEEKIESEEAALEEQEKRTPYPKQKHEIETKRWEVTSARRLTEEEKWEIEKKIVAINDEVGTITEQYQKLLDQEETWETALAEINKKLDDLI